MNLQENRKVTNLFEAYSQIMLREAYYILKDKSLAQDAVSDAFIKVIENLDKINEEDCHKTRAYLVIIVRNISINMYNRNKRLVQYDDAIENEESSKTVEDFYNLDKDSYVIESLSKIPFIYADVLYLELQDFSNQEIADLLGITYANVRKRLSRAKAMLREIISEEER